MSWHYSQAESPLLLSGQTSGPEIRGPIPQFREALRPLLVGPLESLGEGPNSLLFGKLISRGGVLLPRGPA